jgi:hypothetical protein
LFTVLACPGLAQISDVSESTLAHEFPSSPSRVPPLPELRCKLRTARPQLDYELRFSSAYLVAIPLQRLRGGGNRLTATVVIHPLSPENAEPVRLRDVAQIRTIPPRTKGDLELGGYLAMGEGEYQVDWELRDEAGRSCRVSWNLKARRSGRYRDVDLTLRPGEIQSATSRLFRPDGTSRPPANHNFRVKLLVNLDMRTRRSSRVQLWRYVPMISSLRVMSRHADLAEFSVVAFSVKDQKILHRQAPSSRIDFPGLGDSIESLSPGTVDFETLRRGSDLDFLDNLFRDELGDGEDFDAVIFMGSDDRYGKRISRETIENLKEKRISVFYLRSMFDLWRGAIGNSVRSLGGKEFPTREPADLALAVDEIVMRLQQRKAGASLD